MKQYTPRFSKEVVITNGDAAESKYRTFLLRVIGDRLRAARRELVQAKDTERRVQITSEIQRLQTMQTQLRQVPPATVGFDHPKARAAMHRAIKTRRQAIRRKLRRKITKDERERLTHELQDLALAETQFFGIKHRDANLPLGKDGKPYIPKTARGKLHVPIAALPLNTRGRRHVPTPRDIVADAVFEKFVNKGNLPMALAKLAAINPNMYRKEVERAAKSNPAIRRAMNRIGSDVSPGWPIAQDELLVLENFYATTVLRRPLLGMAYDHAVWMLNKSAGKQMTVDRYRRILRKYLLSKKD